MKKTTVIVVSCFLLMLFSSAQLKAQSDESSLTLPKFGIGLHGEQYRVSDAVGNSYSAYSGKVLLPINLTQHFRIEPEIGLIWSKEDDSDDQNLGLTGGIGLFGMWQREQLNFYAGTRFTINSSNSEGYYEIDGESSRISEFGFKVGPVLGFEYFLNKHLSFGGEVGLMYRSNKSTETMPDLPSDPYFDMEDEEISSTGLGFESGILIRAYF